MVINIIIELQSIVGSIEEPTIFNVEKGDAGSSIATASLRMADLLSQVHGSVNAL